MKRFYFLIFFLAVTTTTAFSQAQGSRCTQVLRVARTTYEQGRLHELPGLVEGCLKSGFTKEEKRETYRLLTLAYIYLEEPEKADQAMLELLNTDHFFEVNPTLDPAEFIALYKKYRTWPLFSIGLKGALNITQPITTQYYYIASEGGGQGTYSFATAFQVFIVGEKEFTKGFMQKIVISPEIGYVGRSHEYTNNSLNVPDFTPYSPSSMTYAVSQQWLDFNVMGHYKFKNRLDQKLYGGIGPGLSLLLSSSNQATTTLNGQQQFAVTGPAEDDKASYNNLVYSVSVLAGGKIKLGDLYLTADLRYQIGLNNVVNNTTRTNQVLGYDYQVTYNNYRMNNIMANIGIIYPYFKPKKLIK